MRARRFTPAEKSSAHIQFITSGPTVLGAGPRWADQLNRSNETTETTPQITTIFSASTSISVPDARERTFATAFIATSKFGLLMRQPECLLAGPARGACELAHNRGLILSKMPPAEVRASQHAAPFMLQTRSVCASLVGVLQKCTAAVWRANWARARSALFRSFGLPKFLAEIFGRNQQPDDDGTNDGFGADLLPGKTQVIIGDVSQR
jgi:hypothetical protein